MLLGTRRDPLFGNCWFDQYQSGDGRGVARCEHPHHESAIGMSDQDVRSGHRGDFQQLMEFVSDASRRARHQTALAPAEPGAAYAHARVTRATDGCTRLQLREEAPSAASKTTVGAPSPAQ